MGEESGVSDGRVSESEPLMEDVSSSDSEAVGVNQIRAWQDAGGGASPLYVPDSRSFLPLLLPFSSPFSSPSLPYSSSIPVQLLALDAMYAPRGLMIMTVKLGRPITALFAASRLAGTSVAGFGLVAACKCSRFPRAATVAWPCDRLLTREAQKCCTAGAQEYLLLLICPHGLGSHRIFGDDVLTVHPGQHV